MGIRCLAFQARSVKLAALAIAVSVLVSALPAVAIEPRHAVAARTAANSVWAVGSVPRSSGSDVGLIERWNGSSWRRVVSPTRGNLIGVTAVSRSNAWAVGSSGGFTGGGIPATHALVLHWMARPGSRRQRPKATSG